MCDRHGLCAMACAGSVCAPVRQTTFAYQVDHVEHVRQYLAAQVSVTSVTDGHVVNFLDHVEHVGQGYWRLMGPSVGYVGYRRPCRGAVPPQGGRRPHLPRTGGGIYRPPHPPHEVLSPYGGDGVPGPPVQGPGPTDTLTPPHVVLSPHGGGSVPGPPVRGPGPPDPFTPHPFCLDAPAPHPVSTPLGRGAFDGTEQGSSRARSLLSCRGVPHPFRAAGACRVVSDGSSERLGPSDLSKTKYAYSLSLTTLNTLPLPP